MNRITRKFAIGTIIGGSMIGTAFAAGLPLGVSPVDTGDLPHTGDEWLMENPYRAEVAGEDVWREALAVGESGYIQNCARCHGLGVVSGGLAPDLRFLEAEEYGDSWYVERFRSGYSQNGTTKMPAFEETLGQDAAWAIRTYIETRPDDEVMAEYVDELAELRDTLRSVGDDTDSVDPEALKSRLNEIAAEIPTMSGAPVADSIASRAAQIIDGTAEGYVHAAETLTIGLSAAH
ncbi:cytochrome c-550 PedF [Pontivivens nitratireducens]